MLKYSKYLLFNIVRKKALWILLILTIGASILVDFLQIHEYMKHDFQFTASINSFTKMIPFIFGTAFMSMIIVYVFKEGETDGTELMVAAKPIQRKSILLGKFMVIGVALLTSIVFNFILYICIAQYDTLSSGTSRMNFALSISLGGAIVLIIVSLILILISSFLGMMGTVALGIVAAAIFPTVSNVIADVSRGTVTGQLGFNSNSKILNMESVDKLIKKEVTKYTDNPEDYKFSLSSLVAVQGRSYQPIATKGNKMYEKYKDEVWYQYAVYGDMWYQWNKFYDLFTGDNPLMGKGPSKWTLKSEQPIKLTKEEILETAADNTKGTVIVNLSTSKLTEPKKMIKMFTEIMNGTFETPIYSNVGTTDASGKWIGPNHQSRIKDGLIGWDEAEESYGMVNSGHNTLTARFGKYKVIDTFLDSNFSFETRMRGMIAMVHKQWEVVSWIDKATIPALLLYKMVKAALHGRVLEFAKGLGFSPEELELVKTAKAVYMANLNGRKYEKPGTIRGFSNKNIVAATVSAHKDESLFIDSKTSLPLTKENVFERQQEIFNYSIVMDGELSSAIVNEPFVKKNTVLYIWGAIGVLLIGLTVWRYSVRDFK